MNGSPSSKRGLGMLGGIVLILVGLWFLLDRLGLDLPGIGELWPLFPLLGGLALIAGYVLGRETDSGVLVPGVGGLLGGLFFLMITMGPLRWADLNHLWPVFPLIGGVTFGAVWVASGRRDAGVLGPAVLGIVVGVTGLLFTHHVIRYPLFSTLWPLAVIGLGVWILFKNSRGRRS